MNISIDRREKYNWNDIQLSYDTEQLSLRDISKKFGCAMNTLIKAVKRGDLKTRSCSAGVKIAKIRKPQVHSEETKKKISEIRKKFIQENPDKVPYRMYHYAKHKPYTETYFIDLFQKENIDLKFHLDVGIYELDFYNKDAMLCVEIDGNQHYYDKKIIESDIRRTKHLESLGWKVVRIRWSEYQKKTFDEKKQVIEYLKNIIEVLKK